MEIKVRRYSPFHEVVVTEGHTSIDLGLLSDKESKELAKLFRETAELLDGENS